MRFALLAYPDLDPEQSANFLSFTEERAKYTLGIGGRFRILDFIFSMAHKTDVRHILLYQDRTEEQLQGFLQNYVRSDDLMRIHLFQADMHNFIQDTINVLKSSRIDAVIMYGGDNPVLFDMNWAAQNFLEINKPLVQYIIKNPIQSKFYGARSKYRVLFAKRETFITILQTIQKETKKTINIFERIHNLSNMQEIPTLNVHGLYANLHTITDYYMFNMNLLQYKQQLDPFLRDMGAGSFLAQKGSTLIGKNGTIYNSIIAEGCDIDGTVVDSIIFPGVSIHKGAEIIGSVILPNNHIGSHAKVYHSIVEEAQDRQAKDTALNIGDHCLIGKMDSQFMGSNSMYPDLLKDGLTVIGRNCSIPRKVKIGANCFISPMTNKMKIKMYNRVTDGAVL